MKILIVEDVTLVAERIESLTQAYFGERIARLDLAYSYERALVAMDQQVYDLVFLDLNLNGKDGFELLNRARPFHTVVITANENEAAKAFDLGIFDFIRKPIGVERFTLAMNRLEAVLDKPQADWLPIRIKGGVELLKLIDVNYIKAAKNYSEIFLKSNRSHLHDYNINRIQALLPDHFVRIHRSHITATDNIKRFINHGAGKYQVELLNGAVIPINRDSYRRLTRQS